MWLIIISKKLKRADASSCISALQHGSIKSCVKTREHNNTRLATCIKL